jgi:hypothetical protein
LFAPSLRLLTSIYPPRASDHLPLHRHRYLSFAKDRAAEGYATASENMSAFLSLMQCLLLGSFAAILGAHRSQILDKNGNGPSSATTPGEATNDDDTYEPPRDGFA